MSDKHLAIAFLLLFGASWGPARATRLDGAAGLWRRGKLEEARRLLEGLTRTGDGPEARRARVALARLALRRSRLRDASVCLGGLPGDWLPAVVERARVALAGGDHREWSRLVAYGLRLKAEGPESQLARARLLVEKADAPAALRLARPLLSGPQGGEAAALVLEILAARGRNREILSLTKGAAWRGWLARRPELAAYRAGALRAFGRPEEALAALDRAFLAGPACAELLLARARLCEWLGVEGSGALLARALNIDPTSAAVLLERARIAWSRGDPEGALADCRRVALSGGRRALEAWLLLARWHGRLRVESGRRRAIERAGKLLLARRDLGGERLDDGEFRARWLRIKGLPSAARFELGRSLAGAPLSRIPRFLAWSLEEGIEPGPRWRDLLAQVLHEAPADPGALLLRARGELVAGRGIDAGIEGLRDLRHPPHRLVMARVLVEAGKEEDAAALLRALPPLYRTRRDVCRLTVRACLFAGDLEGARRALREREAADAADPWCGALGRILDREKRPGNGLAPLRSVSTSRFTVRAVVRRDMALGPEGLDVLEAQRARLRKVFGFEPGGVTELVIVPHVVMVPRDGGAPRRFAVRRLSPGRARIVMVSPGSEAFAWRPALRHALYHLFWRARRGPRLPSWVEEGMALAATEPVACRTWALEICRTSGGTGQGALEPRFDLLGEPRRIIRAAAFSYLAALRIGAAIQGVADLDGGGAIDLAGRAWKEARAEVRAGGAKGERPGAIHPFGACEWMVPAMQENFGRVDAELAFRRSQIHMEGGRFAGARALLEGAAGRAGGTRDLRSLANGLGILAFRQGRIDEAIVRFREALKVDPAYDKALRNLAVALYTKGNKRQGKRLLERLLARLPRRRRLERAQCLRFLGLFALRGRRTEEALRFLERSARLLPHRAGNLYLFARTLMGSGATRRGMVMLERARRLDPLSVEANLALARTLERPTRTAARAWRALAFVGSPALRRRAMQAAALLPPAEGVPVLRHGLRDLDRGTRVFAVRALVRLRKHPGELALIAGTDPDPYVRAAALAGVAEIDWSKSRPLLVTALADADEHVRSEAIRTLAQWTGTDRGFKAEGKQAERKSALDRWKAWLAAGGPARGSREVGGSKSLPKRDARRPGTPGKNREGKAPPVADNEIPREPRRSSR